MLNFDQASDYLINKLPMAGFTASGSSFYRNIGGSSVVVTIPRVDSSNARNYFETITGNLTAYSGSGSRSTAFVFVIPDEKGLFKRNTDEYGFLTRCFDTVSRAGIVSEFYIVDLYSGDVLRIAAGGFVDREVWKLVSDLGKLASPESSAYRFDEMNGTRQGYDSGGDFRQGQYRGNVRDESEVSYGRSSTDTLRRFGRSNMIVVYILLGLNVLVFILGYISKAVYGYDYLYLYGVQYNRFVFEGEWWRLFSAMFLHADIYHLAGNMLSLFYLGTVVSRYFSKLEFLVLYFVSGFFGNLLSLWFLPENLVSLGASGAVLGLGGVLIYMLVLSKNKRAFRSTGNFFSLAIMVIFNLVYGVIKTGSDINNFAHFGGFIAGFLLALVIEKIVEKKRSRTMSE
ncbi:MAG: rhomboid family intramembrane serine protease [Clostridia bacterium]|nr:rhomboid family intramembrane serine protease [Clostridia bacterium]